MTADVIVTVRVPASLLKAIRERTERDHYSDLSEQIRSIVRKACLKRADPVREGIEEIKERLKEELRERGERERKEELLAAIKELVKGGGGR